MISFLELLGIIACDIVIGENSAASGREQPSLNMLKDE